MGLGGVSRKTQSLLGLLNFVRFLPFPNIYPSSSALRSKTEVGNEASVVLAKAGDDQLLLAEGVGVPTPFAGAATVADGPVCWGVPFEGRSILMVLSVSEFR